MTVGGNGPEAMRTTGSKSKWPLSLVSLVLGLLLYLTGAILFVCLFFFRATWLEPWHYHFEEWSIVAKDAGIVLVLLGIVLYVLGKRKGV